MIIRTQEESTDRGELQVNVVDDENIPIQDAKVIIRDTDNQVVEEIQTDRSGQTENITLSTPPLAYSLDENNEQRPYANYNVEIEAEGFQLENIINVEVLPDELAIQNIRISRQVSGTITIEPHTLYKEYPEKIPEAEIKDVNEPGEIVLSRVVVPEYIVVHDGTPERSAEDYYVLY